MDWYTSILELIDMRSFSNLWFWIALAVLWSSASHWVLGVPYGMVLRARRLGGQAEQDLDDLAAIQVRRLLSICRASGLWILGVLCFALTALVLLGFVYRVELAQALFLMGFPMTLVGALSLSTAQLIETEGAQGAALQSRLLRCRIYIQIIGMVAIFFTALWGMYRNLATGPFGI